MFKNDTFYIKHDLTNCLLTKDGKWERSIHNDRVIMFNNESDAETAKPKNEKCHVVKIAKNSLIDSKIEKLSSGLKALKPASKPKGVNLLTQQKHGKYPDEAD